VDGRFELVVADNGRGFDPDANGRGFGLISMRERAELIGATLKVRSAPSDGTRIHLSLPLSAGQAR
jgi:signal transduction histidine kinase